MLQIYKLIWLTLENQEDGNNCGDYVPVGGVASGGGGRTTQTYE